MSTLPCVFAACVLTGGDTYVRLLRQVPPKNEPFPGLACAICHGHIYFSKRTPQMRRHCDVTFVRRTMCSTSHAGRTKNTSCFFFSSSLNEMHAIKYHSDIIVEVGMFCCDSKLWAKPPSRFRTTTTMMMRHFSAGTASSFCRFRLMAPYGCNLPARQEMNMWLLSQLQRLSYAGMFILVIIILKPSTLWLLHSSTRK